jgi:hypothetical protein
MKKFLLFVLAVLFTATGWAQQFFMLQGTTNNVYPFGSTLSNKTQWLYRPSNFTTTPGAGNITKLYFKTWNGAASYTATYSNFTIRMVNTALNAFANTTFVTGATPVFTGNPVTVPATGQFTWFSFTLQTPFTYTGQNFIIEIEQNGLIGGVTLNCTNAAGSQRIFGNYGNATGTNFDNNIGDLGFDMCAACDSPINVVKNNLKLHSVDLTWDPVSCASGYEYLIDQTPTNPTSFGYATVGVPALSLNNLPDGTCYYIHLKTQCGGPDDTSGWSLDSFCTVADCQIPEVTIDNITGTTAIAHWNAVPGVVSYEYAVGTTPDTPTNGNTTTYTSVKLLGLTPNKPLYFYLKAKCSPTPASPWGTTPFHTQAGTGVDDMTISNDIEMYAYPNPAQQQVTIHLQGNVPSAKSLLRLTDITGKIISTQNVTGEETILNLDGLAPGLYYVEYADEQFKRVIKINKQ